MLVVSPESEAAGQPSRGALRTTRDSGLETLDYGTGSSRFPSSFRIHSPVLISGM